MSTVALLSNDSPYVAVADCHPIDRDSFTLQEILFPSIPRQMLSALIGPNSYFAPSLSVLSNFALSGRVPTFECKDKVVAQGNRLACWAIAWSEQTHAWYGHAWFTYSIVMFLSLSGG
jgi:hypothetical protein